jgi:hypothetical protein
MVSSAHTCARVGRHVYYVREQGNGRDFAFYGGGQRRHSVAVLIEHGVFEPSLTQLIYQEPGEVELSGGARYGCRGRVCARVDANVTEEPLERVRDRLARELRPMVVVVQLLSPSTACHLLG